MKPWISILFLSMLLTACGKSEEAPKPSALPVAPPAPAAQAPAVPALAPPVGAQRAEPASGKYVVVKGDTLFSIAGKHGLKHRDLAQWNGIRDPRRLRVGQELKLDAPGS